MPDAECLDHRVKSDPGLLARGEPPAEQEILPDREMREELRVLKDKADPLAARTADLSNAAGTLADLLADNRPLLHDTVQYLDVVAAPLVVQHDELDQLLQKVPNAFELIGRAGGIYGDFFNLYLCDIGLKLNGLQPGGPVRNVKLLTYGPTGRCTPQ